MDAVIICISDGYYPAFRSKSVKKAEKHPRKGSVYPDRLQPGTFIDCCVYTGLLGDMIFSAHVVIVSK
jgi:hypothetical protein